MKLVSEASTVGQVKFSHAFIASWTSNQIIRSTRLSCPCFALSSSLFPLDNTYSIKNFLCKKKGMPSKEVRDPLILLSLYIGIGFISWLTRFSVSLSSFISLRQADRFLELNDDFDYVS